MNLGNNPLLEYEDFLYFFEVEPEDSEGNYYLYRSNAK